MQVAQQTCVNSNLSIRRYIRRSKAGFVNYTLTRTAEVYEQKTSFFTTHNHSTPPVNQLTKYAVTAQYNVLQRTDLSEEEQEEQVRLRGGEDNIKRTIELSEYIAHFSCCEKCKVLLIGRKALLISDAAQATLKESFENPFLIPFFDKATKIKGLTLVLSEEKVIRDISRHYNEKQVINLVD